MARKAKPVKQSRKKVSSNGKPESEIEVKVSEAAISEQEAETTDAEEEKSPVEQLQEKCDGINDKYLRLYSEFDNFRKRTAKERLDLINSAGKEIFEALLPIIDDFDRAKESMANAKDINSVIEGVELVHSKLLNTMQQRGLECMDSKGKEFDTDHHEAITKIPAPEEDMKGKVVDVIEKGYFLNGKVLRFAKVVVGS